jgi:acetate kinase
MAILVFNSGSSSLKCKIYAPGNNGSLQPLAQGSVTDFGTSACWTWRAEQDEQSGHADVRGHGDAARWVLQRLRDQGAAITAVGHRVVHGGDEFRQPTLLTPATIARIDALRTLAPLHNPHALDVIGACRETFGDAVPMVAVFDTAFFADLPEPARAYALPRAWVRSHGIRRYGFHGLAHRYMYARYRALHAPARAELRVITFQLGNGCSVSAIRDGAPVDTSMGYTPLEGLIMATRPGDVDPGVLVRLITGGMSAAEIDTGLNREAGLLALSGESGDMRTLLAREADGHAGARRAVAAFCQRARKYLGAYLAVLGGAEAIIFGGGIGEHAPTIRARICADMEWCGLRLDAEANVAAAGTEARISAAASTVQIHVVTVDEEHLIARDTVAALSS